MKILRMLSVALIGATLLPATASAATTASVQGGDLRVAGDDARDSLSVNAGAGTIRVLGDGVTAGAGCTQETEDRGASCPRAGLGRIVVALGPEDDRLVLNLPPGSPAVDYAGGPGTDAAHYALGVPVVVALNDLPDDGRAGAGDNIRTDVENAAGTGVSGDVLSGSPFANRLSGGRGQDSFAGGDGDDVIRSLDVVACGHEDDDGPDCSPGDRFADTVACGPGDDIADADDLDQVAPDCEVVAVNGSLSGTEDGDTIEAFRTLLTVYGSAGPDRLSGPGGNELYGGSNGDVLRAGSAVRSTRFLTGGRSVRAANALAGGTGNDKLVGSRHKDYMRGDSGNDRLRGGAGNDYLWGRSGVDRISAGKGHDVIVASDPSARPDRVSCGSGRDRVTADQNDVVSRDCERVRRQFRR